LSPFEQEVIETILRPRHPVFDALRRQLQTCRVGARELTGAGFFASLIVAPDVAPAMVSRDRLHLGDVAATVDGLAHGAGFILWVEKGVLAELEGFSYDEPWPERIDSYAVFPSSPIRLGGAESDLEAVEAASIGHGTAEPLE
jgi:hypothetical protein